MALVAHKQEDDVKEVSAKATPSKDTYEGRTKAIKGKGKMIEDDDSSTQDELDDLDEHLAFLTRKFSKLKFKRNPAFTKPFRRDNQQNKINFVDRSKFKCYNCGIAGHFSSECKTQG